MSTGKIETKRERAKSLDDSSSPKVVLLSDKKPGSRSQSDQDITDILTNPKLRSSQESSSEGGGVLTSSKKKKKREENQLSNTIEQLADDIYPEDSSMELDSDEEEELFWQKHSWELLLLFAIVCLTFAATLAVAISPAGLALFGFVGSALTAAFPSFSLTAAVSAPFLPYVVAAICTAVVTAGTLVARGIVGIWQCLQWGNDSIGHDKIRISRTPRPTRESTIVGEEMAGSPKNSLSKLGGGRKRNALSSQDEDDLDNQKRGALDRQRLSNVVGSRDSSDDLTPPNMIPGIGTGSS